MNKSTRSVAVIMALLCGPNAHAAPGDTELTDASRAVFTEAIAAASKNQWAVCRTKALGVWQQIENPKVAGLLGSCEAELGMARDAAEHLDFYLLRDDGADPARTKTAKERFDKMRAKVALIILTPTPADAEVRVDGKVLGSGPQRVFVEPGAHVFEVAKGGPAAKKAIEVVAGDEKALSLSAPASEPAGGGGGVGGTGAAGGGGGAGGAEETPGKQIWPTILLGSVAAAGLGVGIGLTVASQGKYGDAEDIAGGCMGNGPACPVEDGQALVDDADTFQNAGIAGFAVAGAAAIGMIVYLIVPTATDSNTKADAARIKLVPVIGPDTAGFTFSTSF